MQKIQFIGNLGRAPEMRYREASRSGSGVDTANGKAVTNFSVAVNRKYTGSDGQQVKTTTWFRVSAWGRLAETCNQYLQKGSQVYVEGRLTVDPSTGGPKTFTRQDGTAGASFDVNAQQVEFLGGGSGNGANDAQVNAQADAPKSSPQQANDPAWNGNEEIPF